MYLSKKTYVKNWDYMKPEEKHHVVVTKNGKRTSIDPKRVAYIEEEMMYWRKANQVHRWFVANVQNGNDNCGEYYVGREQLEELLTIVNAVLKEPSKAADLLPTQEGFFFGSYEYADDYFQDLKETKEGLETILSEPDNGEFYYQSSW